MSIRNVELQTKSKVFTSDTSALSIGGQVPSGMKRWVTFIALDSAVKTDTGPARVYLASCSVSNPTKVSAIASGNLKLLLNLRASKMIGTPRGGLPLQIPDQPDVDKPLFSIGSGKFLGVYSTDMTANLFIQYFDE